MDAESANKNVFYRREFERGHEGGGWMVTPLLLAENVFGFSYCLSLARLHILLRSGAPNA